MSVSNMVHNKSLSIVVYLSESCNGLPIANGILIFDNILHNITDLAIIGASRLFLPALLLQSHTLSLSAIL